MILASKRQKRCLTLLKQLLLLLAALMLLASFASAGETALPGFPPEELARYKTLSEGMRDPDVARLKQRMYELGYFSNNIVNTAYTDVTAGYVRQFQQANGLPADGVASPYMQALFYSDYALPKPTPSPRPTATPRPTPSPVPTPTPYMEPAFPLALGDYAGIYMQGGKLWFSPQAVSLSREKTITGYTLALYCRDGEGFVILPASGGGIFQSRTFALEVKPGETLQVPDIRLDGYAGVKHLYAALTALSFPGGGSLSLAREDWRFYSWTLP